MTRNELIEKAPFLNNANITIEDTLKEGSYSIVVKDSMYNAKEYAKYIWTKCTWELREYFEIYPACHSNDKWCILLSSLTSYERHMNWLKQQSAREI